MSITYGEISEKGEIVEDWDGPVSTNCEKYFDNIDEAVKHYLDDCWTGGGYSFGGVPLYPDHFFFDSFHVLNY